MLKKNTKRLLVLISLSILCVGIYICLPFLINFDQDKKITIENLISEMTTYQINIKGDIKYKLSPVPALEITEVYLATESENSIVNKIIINISVYDLLKNRLSFGNIFLHGGEFIADLNNLNQLAEISGFKEKKITFEEVAIKFFDQKKSFNFNQFKGRILYKNNKIEKMKGNFDLGEVLFKFNYKDNKLSIGSKEINFKANIENVLNKKKKIKFNYNNSTIFPGINEIFTTFYFEQNNNNFIIETEKFETNLFDGVIKINNYNDTSFIVIDGIFDNANFRKISSSDLANFLQKNINLLATVIDTKIVINFKNFKSDNKIFNNAKFNFIFQNGDIFFEEITFNSDKNIINIKGRNIQYQKDNLFFYDLFFKTINLKNICEEICNDKSLVERIQNEIFVLKSKGIVNINKGKITIEENSTNKQFNDNELKKLNSNLNSIVIFGKLENIFELSRYFTLL